MIINPNSQQKYLKILAYLSIPSGCADLIERSQYQARGILEYWIIDPMEQKITVFTLVEGLYEEAVFTREAEIISTLLPPGSSLTASKVLQAGL